MTENLLIITECVRISPACPSSWDCKTDDGVSIHIKYRYGTIHVYRFDKVNEHEILREEIYSCKVSESSDGVMDFDNLRKNLLPFALFICNETNYFDDNIDDTFDDTVCC